MKAEILERLQAERAAQRPVVLLTRLMDGEQHLWPQEALPAALAEAARDALGSEKATNVTLDGETWFVHPHNPPLRIIVVGAVHIAQAMAPMAAPLGFQMIVVDPRRAFATEERLPGVTLRTGTAADAAEAVVDAAIAPTAQTAVRYVLFLLFFLLLLLVFGLLTKALRAANKAPLLGTANRLFGGVLGLACGVLAAFLYVSLCALVVISTNDTLSWLNTDLISQSRLFSLAYPYNLFELLGAAM